MELLCALATGLFKYGVAHYEPTAPRKCNAILAPTRPALHFHNSPETAIDLDEDEDALL